MARRKQQEYDYAKVLFVNQRLTLKEVASRVGVTQKTIGKWADQDKWEHLRKSILTTKDSQLSLLYDQLEWLNTHIATREVIHDIPKSLLKPILIENEKGEQIPTKQDIDINQYPVLIGNVATAKEADTICKITASIKKLEDDTSIGHIVEVAREFIKFVQPFDYTSSQKLVKYFDMFITEKMK